MDLMTQQDMAIISHDVNLRGEGRRKHLHPRLRSLSRVMFSGSSDTRLRLLAYVSLERVWSLSTMSWTRPFPGRRCQVFLHAPFFATA